jgi:hypothetical protein
MRTFVSVLRVQLLQQYRPGKDDRKRQSRLLLTGLALVPFAAMLFGLFSALAAAGMQLGAPALGVELALVTGMVAAVMFGMTYIISTLYYGRDLSLLVPLPLPPVTILWAKFALIMLGELMSLAIFYWPAVIGFAVVCRTGPLFWLLAVPIFITLPVIPLCLATLLAMGLMAATSRRINRDAVRVMLSLISLGLLLAFQTFQRYAVGGSFGNGLTTEGVAAMQRLVADGGETSNRSHTQRHHQPGGLCPSGSGMAASGEASCRVSPFIGATDLLTRMWSHMPDRRQTKRCTNLRRRLR